MHISGVVITKNEAANIAGCLESLKWCDELLVIDSLSTDDTRLIAESCGARVIQHEFKNYGDQKQFAAEQCLGDWILMIDADERVTPELEQEILERLNQLPPNIAGVRIPMIDLMFGKYIQHGGWGRYYRTSLFRRGSIHFDNAVHETPNIAGDLIKFNNTLLHFSHFTIDHFLFKLNKYTSIEAEAAFNQGKKTTVLHLVFLPIIVFLYKYILRRGFLDGLHGFALACMLSMYHFARHIKLLMRYYQKENHATMDEAINKYKVHPRKLPESL